MPTRFPLSWTIQWIFFVGLSLFIADLSQPIAMWVVLKSTSWPIDSLETPKVLFTINIVWQFMAMFIIGTFEWIVIRKLKIAYLSWTIPMVIAGVVGAILVAIIGVPMKAAFDSTTFVSISPVFMGLLIGFAQYHWALKKVIKQNSWLWCLVSMLVFKMYSFFAITIEGDLGFALKILSFSIITAMTLKFLVENQE